MIKGFTIHLEPLRTHLEPRLRLSSSASPPSVVDGLQHRGINPDPQTFCTLLPATVRVLNTSPPAKVFGTLGN